MDIAGAYGGGKAGAAFDPVTFAQRPQVILKAASALLGLFTYWCVGSAVIKKETDNGDAIDQDVCQFNEDATACSYGSTVSIISFLAGLGFLAGEYFFEQMSSVKTRKHYVLGDLGFSAAWAFLSFIGFFYLSTAWSKSADPKGDEGTGGVTGATVFLLLLIGTWGGGAWFAYQRFKIGADGATFSSNFEADPSGTAGYTSYSDGNDAAYQDPPFNQQQQRGMGDFQTPAY